MIYEACPDCVDDPDELILQPGENAQPLRLVICQTCGHTGLVPHEHENAGEL